MVWTSHYEPVARATTSLSAWLAAMISSLSLARLLVVILNFCVSSLATVVMTLTNWCTATAAVDNDLGSFNSLLLQLMRM